VSNTQLHCGLSGNALAICGNFAARGNALRGNGARSHCRKHNLCSFIQKATLGVMIIISAKFYQSSYTNWIK